MGQHQLITILLGIVILGVAIAAGMQLFGSDRVSANKDAILNDMNQIATDAFRYKSKPAVMAGGGGSYTGFVLPEKLKANANATYSCTTQTSKVTIVAVSVADTNNTITGQVASDGHLIKPSFVYTGEFQ